MKKAGFMAMFLCLFLVFAGFVTGSAAEDTCGTHVPGFKVSYYDLSTDAPGYGQWDLLYDPEYDPLAPEYDPSHGTKTLLPDFGALTPYSADVVEQVNFGPTRDNILTSGTYTQLGMRFDGYLEIPEYGKYFFYLHSWSHKSRVYIDGYLVVDNNSPYYTTSPTVFSGNCYLSPGSHKIRVEYVTPPSTRIGYHALDLKWSGPGFGNQDIDVAYVWHDGTDVTGECDTLDQDIVLKDDDHDGLPDAEEIANSTDPDDADSDDDGISDGVEAFSYFGKEYNPDPLDVRILEDYIAFLKDQRRVFDIPTLPGILDSDYDVNLFEHVFKSRNGNSQYYGVLYDNDTHYAVADDNSDISFKTLQPLDITVSVDGVAYEEDNQLIDIPWPVNQNTTVELDIQILPAPVQEDISLKFCIWRTGIVFEDGTTKKTLTAADFNASGRLNEKVRFILTPELRKASLCHDIMVSQGSEKVGWVYD
jgi:hypothetical protein